MLLVAGGIVMAAVIGLGAVILPDPPNLTPIGEQDPPSPPPLTRVGAVLEVSGDRPGVFDLTGGFSEGQFRLADGRGNSLLLGTDPGSGAYLRQATYDGLNLFLDRDQCEIDLSETDPTIGLARFSLHCEDITDVRDTATLTLSGLVDLPLRVAFPDGRYDGGGAVTVTGDIDTEIIVWNTGRPLGPDGAAAGFWIGGASSDDSHFIAIEIDLHPDTGRYVRYIEVDGMHQFERPECRLDTELIARVEPHVNLVAYEIECRDITDVDGELTITLAATVRVDEWVVTPD